MPSYREKNFHCGLVSFLLLAACATSDTLRESAAIRTAGTSLDDRAIERYMRREIIALGDQRPLRIKVRVFNGAVLLVGETETNYAKAYLEERARRRKAVRRVFNRINFEDPISKYSSLEDFLLMSRVHFALGGLEELNDSDLSYLVDRQRIYLMGIVTAAQADIAIKRLSAIEGVAAVVVAFEYLEEPR